MRDFMANEEKKVEKVEAKTEVEFLVGLWKDGWPIADVAGQMVELSHPDKARRTFAFKDANGRKEVVITATKEEWKAWFEAALAKN